MINQVLLRGRGEPFEELLEAGLESSDAVALATKLRTAAVGAASAIATATANSKSWKHKQASTHLSQRVGVVELTLAPNHSKEGSVGSEASLWHVTIASGGRKQGGQTSDRGGGGSDFATVPPLKISAEHLEKLRALHARTAIAAASTLEPAALRAGAQTAQFE